MNTTHLHLLLNHFPVIGTLIGSLILLYGIIKKQGTAKYLAALILTALALISIPVYLTGEPAEETIEKLPGVSEAMIELHEDAANIAIWLMGITGIASLISLLLQWKKAVLANTFFVITFLSSAICFAGMARTGYYGGQIRHSEIRNGSIAAQQSNDGEKGQKENNGKEKDDD